MLAALALLGLWLGLLLGLLLGQTVLWNRRSCSAQVQGKAFFLPEERLLALMQNPSDIVTLLAKDGTIESVSPSIQQILGHLPSHWLSKTMLDLVHPQDLSQARNFLLQALVAPDPDRSIDVRFQHLDGNWCSFGVTAHSLLAKQPTSKTILTYRDVTWRKRQNEQIRLLESVVVNANDSVLITTAEPVDFPGPQIIYVNQAFTQQTGYTPEEVIGKTPRILQGINTDRLTLNKIRSALEQWQSIRVDILNYRKNGTTFWAELSIVPIADETGWFTHWIAIQRDITQRKEAEAEIRNALAQEKELKDLKSRFVSMVSHEFRTPLATIMASSELLKTFSHRLNEAQKRERLNKIQAQVRVMTRLMDDVLLIGQVEANRVQFAPTLLDLKQLCQDILDETELLMNERHTLSFICLEEPGSESEHYARVDEKLLRHILTNLLSNAIKYSPQGGVIILKLHCNPANILFQVQDPGVGIPEPDQEKLFDPFYRASNVGQIAGTGLGLAIIKHATELHGGHIQVASQVGVGSTFTVSIPRLN